MSKFIEPSPGPYHVGLGALMLGVIEIGDANAKRICILESRDYGGEGNMEKIIPNARIIAASWKMKKALEIVLESLKEQTSPYNDQNKLIKIIKDALEGVDVDAKKGITG